MLALVNLAVSCAAVFNPHSCPLAKALRATSRPIIVHVYDTSPEEVPQWAVSDVSACCRKAGATAMLVSPTLIKAVHEEQSAHRGDFPGPLPVIADILLDDIAQDSAKLKEFRELGASAIGVRYHDDDWSDTNALETALSHAVDAACQAGLVAIMLGESSMGAIEHVATEQQNIRLGVGAVAALVESPSSPEDGDSSTVALGCWDGSDEELQRLRSAGFRALLLEDACLADVASGIDRCAALIRAALSKRSRVFSSSMFGTTSSEVVPPSQRNPRLW